MKLRNKDSERGASLVEFALVAPLFFLLIFALIEGAAFFFARNTIGLATADAARSGSIDSFSGASDAEIIAIIDERSEAAFGATVERVVIFKADNDSSIPSDDCKDGAPGADCAVYESSDFGSITNNGWVPANRNQDDLLGIWVVATYEGLTGINPFEVSWNERRYSLIEPDV